MPVARYEPGAEPASGKMDGVSLLRRKAKDDEATDPNDRSPGSGLKYKDLAVLGQLIKAGADLEQPRHALYYLYFADRASAEAAAHEGGARSFGCAVGEPLPQYPGQWSVTCERQGVVLAVATVRDHDDFFDSLALRHGGEYDGWEASV